jgi:bifunctional non-homologous end joining protein LigD
VKHDGFRIVALKQGGRAKVWSPRGADFTYRFLTIAKAVLGAKAAMALIDGEAVVLRNDGCSDFYALLTKRGGRGRRSCPASMVVAPRTLAAKGADSLRPGVNRR